MSSAVRYVFVLPILLASFSCIAETKCSNDLAVLSEAFKCTGNLIQATQMVKDRPGPKDCAQIKEEGSTKSGVYRIWPSNWKTAGTLQVYCDMDTDGGGWTTIQRRGQYGNPQDYFYRGWSDYKLGFGSPSKEYWLGNDAIFVLTNDGDYSLRIDMKDKEGNTRYAAFNEFWIDNEERLYKMHVSGYQGNAGDSVTYMDTVPFTTKDRDNDKDGGNCGEKFKGGWWYVQCHFSNLNGLNLNGEHESFADGIEYYAWKGHRYSLTEVEMKIRPKICKRC